MTEAERVSLKEYVDRVVGDLERHIDQRFDDAKEAVRIAQEAQDRQIRLIGGIVAAASILIPLFVHYGLK